MQTKLQSLSEVTIGYAIGYVLAIITQAIIYPWFNISATILDNMAIAAIFTIVSISRSYIVRRFFNWFHNRGEQ